MGLHRSLNRLGHLVLGVHGYTATQRVSLKNLLLVVLRLFEVVDMLGLQLCYGHRLCLMYLLLGLRFCLLFLHCDLLLNASDLVPNIQRV